MVNARHRKNLIGRTRINGEWVTKEVEISSCELFSASIVGFSGEVETEYRWLVFQNDEQPNSSWLEEVFIEKEIHDVHIGLNRDKAPKPNVENSKCLEKDPNHVPT